MVREERNEGGVEVVLGKILFVVAEKTGVMEAR